jgi:hypothetical protein
LNLLFKTPHLLWAEVMVRKVGPSASSFSLVGPNKCTMERVYSLISGVFMVLPPPS